MSETSHAAGRIAILTAFTLLFAAAWRSDAPATARLLTPLMGNKRGAGCTTGADGNGSIARGAGGTFGARLLMARPDRVVGTLALEAVPAGSGGFPVAMPFSGRPALLGRSTQPVTGDDDARTAAAGSESAPQ
jgi:hypothetical protein